MFFEGSELLEPTSLANLRNYRYSSVDLSPTSKYVLNPFWTYCAQFMPPWLAPNVITLLGVSGIIVDLFLIAIYAPEFRSGAPRWVYAVFGVTLFFYQTMDNIDGKQARKTGTSSPLGELFDHGIDSLNCLWGGLVVVALLGVGSTPLAALMLLALTLAMFLSTWETFHTHTLFLGYLNGPTEGILLYVFFCFLTAIFGPTIWDYQVLGMSLRFIYAVATCVSVFVAHAPACIDNVRKALTQPTSPLQGAPMPNTSMEDAIGNALPYLAVVTSTLVWIAGPDSRVLVDNHLMMFGLGYSFLFGKVTTSMILAHLCRQPFPNCYTAGVLVGIPAVLYGVLPYIGLHLRHEEVYLVLFVLAAFGDFALFAYSVINALCDFLGIRCFTVPS